MNNDIDTTTSKRAHRIKQSFTIQITFKLNIYYCIEYVRRKRIILNYNKCNLCWIEGVRGNLDFPQFLGS